MYLKEFDGRRTEILSSIYRPILESSASSHRKGLSMLEHTCYLHIRVETEARKLKVERQTLASLLEHLN